MSDIYGKGAKGKATKLHAQLVRARGACQRCGARVNLQCAHIVKRRFNATRTDETNAWCLCSSCHFLTEDWAIEFLALVDQTIGRDAYEALKRKAYDGVKANETFWKSECERLSRLLDEEGEAA